MTDEAAEDANSLSAVGKQFDSFYIGTTIHDTAAEIRVEINRLMALTHHYLPYLTCVGYTDVQHQLAERRMQQLTKQIDEQFERYRNVMTSAQILQYPVSVNT